MKHMRDKETIVRSAYEAFGRGDLHGFLTAFADDVIWHGGGGAVQGKDMVRAVVEDLVRSSDNTLTIEVHDVLASKDHVVVLQVTRAQRAGRRLEDRVAYVYHLRDGKIAEAWLQGDPSAQDAFWAAADGPDSGEREAP
jgi:ketosteroid isomerase-like protein